MDNCIVCSSQKGVINHHRAYEPEEIVVKLCHRCHGLVHRLMKKYNNQQLIRLLSEIELGRLVGLCPDPRPTRPTCPSEVQKCYDKALEKVGKKRIRYNKVRSLEEREKEKRLLCTTFVADSSLIPVEGLR